MMNVALQGESQVLANVGGTWREYSDCVCVGLIERDRKGERVRLI